MRRVIMMSHVRRNELFSFMFSKDCVLPSRLDATDFMIRAVVVAAVFFLMSTTCQAQSVQPIRIGSIFAKTGPGAEENSPNYRMVTLAAGQINAERGLLGRPVEVIEFDTGSTALGARQAAEAAVKAKVSAVIGPSWSSQAMSMGPVLQQAGIPMLGATTTASEVTEIGDYIFRVCYTDALQAKALAAFAYDDLKARRAVVVTIAGDVYSEGLSSGFIER
ncbi:MAG: hypothetical protein EOM37_19650, partial [Proteobacteria bacterium]|nr:hypothetical protein [Pseudomonadota bacterium]